MDKVFISVGQSRKSKIWKNTELTWLQLVDRLGSTTRTSETMGEYKNMSKLQQDSIKDVGGFVGGKLKEGKRKNDSVDKRYILTLDADFASEDFCDKISMFFDFTYCIYSTHKHTTESPRLRLIIPFSRPCEPWEYEAVGRLCAKDIGIDMFDDTTYQPHRLMYWPSTSYDGEFIFKHEENSPLDIDKYLSRYNNPKDITEWPTSSRTLKNRDRLIKKQEDPLEKNGVIGAFCRCYTVDEAMDKFIPEVYSQCRENERYTYVEGSTAGGLVIYGDGKFAYSNHSTDPIGGMLCNAFDLIRLHKFGSLDDEAAYGTPVNKLPSYLAMTQLASKDTQVKVLMHKERTEEAKSDFSKVLDLTEDTEEDNQWVEGLEVDGKGRCLSTIDNIKKVLTNDKPLKKRIAYNEFTRKHVVFKDLPWEATEKYRDWTDSDDAGLRHYLERVYGIKGKASIQDAWVLVCRENKYHPVRDYLNGLEWDGIKRLDDLFCDYLGAERNLYTQMITRKSIVAAVARVFIPGIKFDTVMVLVGEQGCGKSQILKRLGVDWFSDTITTVQGKDAYEQIQGFWIVELAELSALKKADVEAIKHFIGKSEDSYRAAYGHHMDTYPRQCVFFATTNTYEFLKDMTGNRRFFPIDVDPNKATKDMWEDLTKDEIGQIWAEAVSLFHDGEKIHIYEDWLKELAEQEQDKHLEESPLTGDIKMYLDKKLPENWSSMDLSQRRMFIGGNEFNIPTEGIVERTHVCALEVWCEVFCGDKKDLNLQKSKEIKNVILKTGGWEQMKYPLTFGNLYGKQRGYTRK